MGLLVTCFNVWAPDNSVYAQDVGVEFYTSVQQINNLVTFEFENVPIKEALEKLAREANVGLSYNSDLLPDKRVSMKLKDIHVFHAVNKLLNGTGLEAGVSANRTAIIIQKVQDGNTAMNANANIFQEEVNGIVMDGRSGESLPGVNIVIKGTDRGTTTDLQGNYNLSVPTLNDTLVFSYIGYQTQEIPINGRNEINVTLQMDIVGGEEIVVVGYGIQRRETLTGSVSALSGERLEKVPVTNVSNSLSGQIPGVVTVNSSGEPGSDGATIRIRGNHTLGDNNPLIVIDGVPNRSGGLERLNPKDIENISVLKDATAAIYGSQAANGVILITTKRGQAGATQVNLDVNQGFNQPTRVPEMADAATYLTMLNEIDMYRGRPATYSQERIENHRQGTDPWLYPNTDWFAETLKPASYQTRADVSISGGTESVQYYLSLGGLTEDGFYENSATRYDQYSFRSNIDGQISDHVSVGLDISGRLEDRNYPTRSVGNIFRMVMRGKPHLPAYWPNGQPGPDIEYGDNPVVVGTPATGYDSDKRYYLQTNLRLNVEVPGVDGLSFRGNLAYDNNYRLQKVWQTPWTLFTFDRQSYIETGEPVLQGSQRGYSEPRLFQESGQGEDILLNLVGNFQQNVGDHSYSVLLGTEQQTFSNSFMNAFRRFYISDQIDQLFAGGEEERSNDGSASEGARVNYFTRVNYDYHSKYLFEFVGRYDGSYIFPEDKRFGFFPAFSIGWRLTQENWFQNATDLFDELKLRASWGQTGNDRIDEFQYLATYGFGSGYVFDGGTIHNSVFQTRIPNRDVSWEVANQLDLGVEAQILDNRLSFEIDYFNYLRTEILWWRNASVPMTGGFSLPRENIGEVASSGFDGSITYRDQISSDFLFDITLNGGFAENEIKFWDEAPGAPEWQQSTGSPMNTDLYYNVIGVFQDEANVNSYPSWEGARPGDLIFEDVNGDGEIDGRDRIRIDKTGTPKWTGGLNINANYKQFDFSILFQGAAGAVQYLKTESGEIGNFLQNFAENRWTPDNPSSEHPRTWNRDDEYWASNANTYFLRDMDYLRLKNLEIGYSLPPEVGSGLGIQRLRIYASGFNLLTWDKLKVMDPEVRTSDGQYYPQKRVFNLGISVTF
ncbi:MAG: SusC/RagA family TonB-linked outer membrane protein [Balneolaceae bacterium]